LDLHSVLGIANRYRKSASSDLSFVSELRLELGRNLLDRGMRSSFLKCCIIDDQKTVNVAQALNVGAFGNRPAEKEV
jgi:hypothetical protein